ncbi:unnamed protein product [Closterium sp. NIES-65]|nr:unnamed protein product [Closterium sp. NIES-65]
MATPSVLVFDAEGRAVDFEVWVDDLQLFLQCDRKDGLLVFDLTSGASTAPAADADSTIRSQWATRDAAARLAVRSHFPSSERAHFSQYKSARTLDHFLSVCPTTLTVDLLEERLMAAEKSIVAVGASCGGHRAPFFEGCSLSPLLPSVASAAAVDFVGTEPVGAASAPSGRRRTGKGKGTRGAGVGVGGGGGGGGGNGGGGGSGGGGGGFGGDGGGGGGGGGSGGGGDGGGGGGGGGRGGAGRGGSAQRSSFGGAGWGAGSCAYVLRTGDRNGEPCGGPHTTQRCFGRLTDAWRLHFPDATEIPRWGELLRSGVAIFDLDYDAILAAMYVMSTSDEGDCYLCVLPDSGIEAAGLGAGETTALGARASAAPGTGASALSGTTSAQALHTFTLDSGASRSFFRDRTTLTPLSRPVAVSLADPSGGPVLGHFSTVLPCPAAPSGTLSGLYLPSFSTNLVSGADLQDGGVDQFTPASQRATHCTCARTGGHLATFTRQPGSSLYTLTTESPPVAESGQVAALSQTLLWHHRLGHPSLPCLRGMASRVLVSGLPWSFPPLPPGPAPTCVPCVEGRQRAAPHSSEFPSTEALLQTLHMEVWGPARVRGQGHERYFLLVVDGYSRYTTLFPLCSKGDVTEVLIDWICAARLQHRESFGSDFPVLLLHSDRGGEFSSGLLGAFSRAQGIRQTFTLPASPQQNGIAERHIGMVMDVARTSMIHAAAPHFLWPFAVRYAAHEINLQPWLSPRAVPCVFLGFPLDVPGWQFYHPTSRRVLSSQDVTFDESVPYYRLFPYRTAPLPPPPLFLVSAVDSGAARGAEPGGAEAGGAEPGGAEPGAAEPRGAEPGGAEPGGAGSGGPLGASSRQELPSPQELCDWFARRWSRAAGAGGATIAADPGVGAGGTGATGPGGARTGGTRAAGNGGAAGAAGVGPAGGAAGAARGTGAARGVGAGGAAGAGTSEGAGVGAAGARGTAGAGAAAWGTGSLSLLQPASPLPAPSPYTGPTGGLAERREPASCPASPVRAARTSSPVPRPRPPAVPGTHQMALRPSTAPLRVPLPSPPESSLPVLADPESDSLRAASPTVTRLLATVVTDPSFESTATSSLVPELVDFAARCRLDYTACLVAESESVYPPSVGGECALSADVLEDRQEEVHCFDATLPHLVSMLIAPEGDSDAPDIPTP